MPTGYSILEYTGDGSTDTFSINFTLGYLSLEHIKCRVADEVDGSGNPAYRTLYEVAGNPGVLRVGGTVPAVGEKVVFTRTVPKDALTNDYADGAILTGDNLDNSLKQAMMAVHEALDGRNMDTIYTDVDMTGHKLRNVFTDPSDPDSIATVAYVGDAPVQAAAAAESAANALASQAAAEAAAAAASAAAAELTNLGVSSFGKTLLDDADAATARATLGANLLRCGAVVNSSTSRTLGASDLGKYHHTYNSPTLTLPPFSVCEQGSMLLISCYSGVTTIARNGTEALHTTSSVTSFTLNPGDFAILTTNGTNSWAAVISRRADVDLPVFNSLLAQISAGRASGAVPNGWCWLFKTDELATKTGATYDDAGDYYSNVGPVTVTAEQSSSTGTFGFYTDIDDLWDGDSVGCFYWADPNAAAMIDFGAGNEKVLVSWTMRHGPTDDHTATWASVGAHRYWRLRFTAAMANSGSASVSWVIEYSDNGTTWTAASSAMSYTANSVVVSCTVTAVSNMTLKPYAVTLSAEPNTAVLYMLHKAVDTVTLNTDIKVIASLDGGSNWSSFGTLETVCAYDADYSLLKASIDVSALTGTSFVWEITTLNAKSQRVRAVAALFS